MTYTLRKTKHGDIPYILSMYQGASRMLKELGIDQWQNGYPNEDTVKQDISNGESYVLIFEDEVVASAMISMRGESTYNSINGAWSQDKPYAVIHRIVTARTQQNKGLASRLLEVAETSLNIDYIRIDTHLENKGMRHFLVKNGFKECGMIKLADFSDRIAYDKIVNI